MLKYVLVKVERRSSSCGRRVNREEKHLAVSPFLLTSSEEDDDDDDGDETTSSPHFFFRRSARILAKSVARINKRI